MDSTTKEHLSLIQPKTLYIPQCSGHYLMSRYFGGKMIAYFNISCTMQCVKINLQNQPNLLGAVYITEAQNFRLEQIF